MILGDLENHALPPVTIYAHAHTGPSHPDWTEVSPGSEKTLKKKFYQMPQAYINSPYLTS